MTLLLALAIFAVLVLLGYALSALALDRQQAQQALSNRLTTMAGASAQSPIAQSLLKDQRLSNIPVLDAVLGSTPFVAPLVRMIEQAGLRRRVGEVLLYVLLIFFIVMLGIVLAGGGFLIGILFGGIAASVPLMVVGRMRAKRTVVFGEQLPDALDLIRAALQAGHGLVSACGVVGETFADPVAQ